MNIGDLFYIEANEHNKFINDIFLVTGYYNNVAPYKDLHDLRAIYLAGFTEMNDFYFTNTNYITFVNVKNPFGDKFYAKKETAESKYAKFITKICV